MRLEIWPALIAATGVCVLAGLGVWQLQRLDWKTALIAQAEANMTAPPLPLARALEAGLEAAEYRAVEVRGRFDHARELRLFTQREGDGPGVSLVTPLVQADGTVVAVERGFVPQRLADPAIRPGTLVAGEVTVTGVVRLASPRNWMTPADDVPGNLWYTRDPGAFAAAWGLDLAAPVVVVAEPRPDDPPWPRAGQSLNLRNNHFGYAMTWFALAAVLALTYVVYVAAPRPGR